MRFESAVTSVTWIPSEAIEGMPKLRSSSASRTTTSRRRTCSAISRSSSEKDAFREANELRGWIEVQEGRIVDHGSEGRGLLGVTRMRLGPARMAFPAVAFPLIQPEPEVGDGWVRFVQTAGGRMGLPAPRRVRGKPYFQLASASAWTTLELIIYADGRSQGSLVGASPFPRHWVYDDEGQLVEKSGTIDFEKWYRESYGENTPWGGEDTPAFVTAVESQLERELTESVMQLDAKLPRRRLAPGGHARRAGGRGRQPLRSPRRRPPGRGRRWTVAEVGPGAILGERAAVEGGPRTATLRAVTPCRLIELESDADQQVRADRARALALAGGGGLGLVVTAGTRCDNRRGGGKNGSRPPVLTAWCPPSGARTKGVRMEMTSRQAALVDIRDFSDGITATIPRAEFAAALTSEEPAELFLELTRPESDDKADVAVTWNRDELERLLAATAGPTVTLAFKRDELETALDESDVEMHGFRDKALILSVAAAAAVGGASSAAAATHDEAGSTARGITPSYLAVHDEATLAARGIEAPVVASHDEATLAARGIQTPVAASHDEATLAARGIQTDGCGFA